MGGVIYIETLDRRGGVLHRRRVDVLPARIGRSLSNDIVLDDPHVSPEHAEVTRDENGLIMVRDLGSENGLFAGAPKTASRTDCLQVAPGETLRIGRTLLRVRTEEEELTPTLVESEVGAVMTWLSVHWSASGLFVVAVCLTAAWGSYVTTWTEFTVTSLIAAAFRALLQVFIWAGAWTLATRVVHHESRFSAHLTIACILYLVAQIVVRAAKLAGFLHAPVMPMLIITPVVLLIVLALGIYSQLQLAGVAGAVRRISIAAVGAIVLVGAARLDDIDLQPNHTNDIPYSAQLESIDPRLLQPITVDEFFSNIEPLREELDRSAESDVERNPS